VAILNPDHLFEQAEKLVEPPPAGPPRQVDVRRAISAAYYGIFHATITAAADHFVGAIHRATSRYGLVYRSVDHSALRKLCEDVAKATLPTKYTPYVPQNGFGANMSAFASAILDLQEQRLQADYDPSVRVKTSNAKAAVSIARAALQRFQNADSSEREAFLSLLVFPPRR
jgi:hypothetical protein